MEGRVVIGMERHEATVDLPLTLGYLPGNLAALG
jgi:hypothetical protein